MTAKFQVLTCKATRTLLGSATLEDVVSVAAVADADAGGTEVDDVRERMDRNGENGADGATC